MIYIVMGQSFLTKKQIVVAVFDNQETAELMKDQLNQEFTNKYWVEKHAVHTQIPNLYGNSNTELGQKAELGQSFIP